MQNPRLTLVFLILLLTGCNSGQKKLPPASADRFPESLYPKNIAEIPLPDGFQRVKNDPPSFAAWLRSVPLRKDKTVYLYNGIKKRNQTAQYAVADLPIGTKDLQQCADVVMRLRADYLFSTGQSSSISFTDYAGKKYSPGDVNTIPAFQQFMERVYSFCGSASLEKQLQPVSNVNDLQPGDIFIRGGFPGHAMIVADAATNKNGKKVFLLMQGFLPAQDIHVVNNPSDKQLSPWYEVNETDPVITPEWIFTNKNLRRW